MSRRAHTDEERAAIKREFARRRWRQMLVTLPFVPVIFVAVGYQKRAFYDVPGLSPQRILVLLIVAAVVCGGFAFRNWRCPACSRYLGRAINPRFCPRCGITLR